MTKGPQLVITHAALVLTRMHTSSNENESRRGLRQCLLWKRTGDGARRSGSGQVEDRPQPLWRSRTSSAPSVSIWLRSRVRDGQDGGHDWSECGPLRRSEVMARNVLRQGVWCLHDGRHRGHLQGPGLNRWPRGREHYSQAQHGSRRPRGIHRHWRHRHRECCPPGHRFQQMLRQNPLLELPFAQYNQGKSFENTERAFQNLNSGAERGRGAGIEESDGDEELLAIFDLLVKGKTLTDAKRKKVKKVQTPSRSSRRNCASNGGGKVDLPGLSRTALFRPRGGLPQRRARRPIPARPRQLLRRRQS